MINVKQIAKFVVGLGDRVAPADVEEGMRVGVDRNKYQIQIPLPPKIDPTVTMMTVEEKPDITCASPPFPAPPRARARCQLHPAPPPPIPPSHARAPVVFQVQRHRRQQGGDPEAARGARAADAAPRAICAAGH